MTELRRMLSTSVLSLLLVVWGLFTVCSGRVPDVNYDDDLLADGPTSQDTQFAQQGAETDNSELMSQLAQLDEGSNNLDDSQRNEILTALGISPSGSEISRKTEDDFLSEELFLDLEVEIADLEKASKHKAELEDSLRAEVQEADFQLHALNQVVGGVPAQFASTTPVVRQAPAFTGGGNSDYAASYQDALNDVYARRFPDAIAKFRALLSQPDTDKLADNCQYWIGEAYYALGQYEVAIAEFEKVFAYDHNNKVDDAQFMIGLTYIKLGDLRTAGIELQNLMSFYQDSEYLARAEREFGDLNM